ncbi:MAG TPA: phosphoribosyltransferase [Anaerolineae bacterium]|nr:phosphoribosyltransferase [Anaerolineae bacterium]
MAAFEDRRQAGKRLAERLTRYAGRKDVAVLGLARGGLPVAFEVAKALHAPLDVFIVRKLGVPGHSELAMGAIASGGVRVMNDDVVRSLSITSDQIETIATEEQRELERREREYRGDAERLDVSGKTAILVDDGLATGASMRAAVTALRRRDPQRIVVAVPTAAPSVCRAFENEVDEVVCLVTPEPFFGVGAWYRDFSQTTDQEVRRLLEEARSPTPA